MKNLLLSGISPQRGASMRDCLVLLSLGIIIHACSQFIRNVTGPLAPVLINDGMSPAQMSLIAGGFFLGMGIAQMPLGISIDRFGAKRTLIYSSILTALGIIGFSTFSSAGWLFASRMSIGLGMGAGLMAPLAIYGNWFSKSSFTNVFSVHALVSTLGAVAAAAPFTIAMQYVDWRLIHLGILVPFGLAILGFIFLVQNFPPGHKIVQDKTSHDSAAKTSSIGSYISGYNKIARNLDSWRLAVIAAILYGGFSMIPAFWGPKYLVDRFDVAIENTGFFLNLQLAGLFIGLMMAGLFAHRVSAPRRLCTFATLVMGLALLVLAVFNPNIYVVSAIFFLMGLITPAANFLYAYGRSLFPAQYIGRVLAFINLGATIGIFLIIELTSRSAIWFTNDDTVTRLPDIAYQAAFGSGAIASFIAAVFFYRITDTNLAES